MKPRWRLMLFLAVLLCVLFTQSGRRAFPVQAKVLPDGSRLRLVNITHGKRHSHIEASLGMQLLYRMLPRSFRSLGPDRYGVLDTPTDQTVAWIHYRPAPAPGGTMVLANWTLYDEHGCEVILGPQTWPIGFGGQDTGPMLIPAPLTPFAHRCKKLGIRFWQTRMNSAPRAVAEFPILEKTEAIIAVPKPEALPASRPFRGMQCKLERLETGVDPHFGTPWALNGPSDVMIRARINLIRGKERVRDWEPCGIRFVDAFGEVFDPRPNVVAERGPATTELRIFGSLWPHEPAYDTNVDLCKTRFADFPKAAVHTIELPVPPPQSSPTRNVYPRKLHVNGRSIEVEDPGWDFAPPSLVIPFTLYQQPDPGYRIVLLRVVDDQGRDLKLADTSEKDRYIQLKQPGADSTYARCYVTVAKPATSIKVTFAVTQPETVRFRVRPTQWESPARSRAAQPNKFK